VTPRHMSALRQFPPPSFVPGGDRCSSGSGRHSSASLTIPVVVSIPGRAFRERNSASGLYGDFEICGGHDPE
jgi:hypothetical protein